VSDYQRKITGLPALGRAIGAAKTGKCKIVMLDLESAQDIHDYLKVHMKRDYQRSYQNKYRARLRLKAKTK
jgi:hypothetical protein